MTARDEATIALIEALRVAHVGLTKSTAESVIDAIPADVLAALAIERGGLEQVAWRSGKHMGDFGYMTYYAAEAGHADHTRLYRLVTP